MKKKILILVLLFTSIQPATNKTHFSQRPQGHHNNIFNSVWKKSINQITEIDKEQHIQTNSNVFTRLYNYFFQHPTESQALTTPNSAFAITPSISFSENKNQLAKYFMFGNKSSLQVGRNTDIDNRYIKFNETASDKLAGTIKFKPNVKTYGIEIDYHQELPNLKKKLFLETSIPLIYTQTDIHLNVDATSSTAGNKTIEDYFHGEEMLTQNGFILQEPLIYGKIKSRKKIGIADVNLALGYHVIKKLLNLKFLTNFSTTSSPKGEYLFEPILGAGGVFGMGVSADGFYKTSDNVTFIYDLAYRYMFTDKQKRVLGLKDHNGNKLNWGQYSLVGKIDIPLVLPAANILRQAVNVTPGSQVEGLFMISCNHENFIAEVGYNFWFKQKEKVKRIGYWDDNAYGFVGTDYQSAITVLDPILQIPKNSFVLQYSNLNNTIGTMQSAGATTAERGTITSNQLDIDAARHPSVFTNKLFFTLGYEWPQKKSSLLLGGGISYEFRTSNNSLNETMIWLKSGWIF